MGCVGGVEDGAEGHRCDRCRAQRLRSHSLVGCGRGSSRPRSLAAPPSIAGRCKASSAVPEQQAPCKALPHRSSAARLPGRWCRRGVWARRPRLPLAPGGSSPSKLACKGAGGAAAPAGGPASAGGVGLARAAKTGRPRLPRPPSLWLEGLKVLWLKPHTQPVRGEAGSGRRPPRRRAPRPDRPRTRPPGPAGAPGRGGGPGGAHARHDAARAAPRPPRTPEAPPPRPAHVAEGLAAAAAGWARPSAPPPLGRREPAARPRRPLPWRALPCRSHHAVRDRVEPAPQGVRQGLAPLPRVLQPGRPDPQVRHEHLPPVLPRVCVLLLLAAAQLLLPSCCRWPLAVELWSSDRLLHGGAGAGAAAAAASTAARRSPPPPSACLPVPPPPAADAKDIGFVKYR